MDWMLWALIIKDKKMKTKKNDSRFWVLVILIFLANSISAQHQKLYKENLFIKDTDTLRYRIMYPKGFEKEKQYPLLLFLHGAGERGNDNKAQLVHGSKLFAEEIHRDSFPAIVIFPQCPKNDYWANAIVTRNTRPISLQFPLDSKPTKPLALVMQLLDEFANRSFVKKEQVYVGGLSMGGMGTFEILYRKPEMFAAAFSICGAGNPEATEKYATKTPLWIFHGAKDNVVSPQSSIDMVRGILKHGGKPNFSLYAKDGHNSWDTAFAEPKFLSWLFSKSKKEK